MLRRDHVSGMSETVAGELNADSGDDEMSSSESLDEGLLRDVAGGGATGSEMPENDADEGGFVGLGGSYGGSGAGGSW